MSKAVKITLTRQFEIKRIIKQIQTVMRATLKRGGSASIVLPLDKGQSADELVITLDLTKEALRAYGRYQ